MHCNLDQELEDITCISCVNDHMKN